jgi:hypothetical protein
MTPSDMSSLGDLSWRVARRCDAGSCVRIAQEGDMVFIEGLLLNRFWAKVASWFSQS